MIRQRVKLLYSIEAAHTKLLVVIPTLEHSIYKDVFHVSERMVIDDPQWRTLQRTQDFNPKEQHQIKTYVLRMVAFSLKRFF